VKKFFVLVAAVLAFGFGSVNLSAQQAAGQTPAGRFSTDAPRSAFSISTPLEKAVEGIPRIYLHVRLLYEGLGHPGGPAIAFLRGRAKAKTAANQNKELLHRDQLLLEPNAEQIQL